MRALSAESTRCHVGLLVTWVYDSWRRFSPRNGASYVNRGAVHHLDIMADLAGAPRTSIFARTWRPQWAEYKGDREVVILMDFANGAHGI